MLRLSYGEGTTSADAACQQRVAPRVVDVAEKPDRRMGGDRHVRRPGQDERHAQGPFAHTIARSAGAASRNLCSDRCGRDTGGTARRLRSGQAVPPVREPVPTMHDGASGAGQCAATNSASSAVRNTKPDGRVNSRAVAPKRITGSLSAVGTSTVRVPDGTAGRPKYARRDSGTPRTGRGRIRRRDVADGRRAPARRGRSRETTLLPRPRSRNASNTRSVISP